jgi:uncharacterized protein
MNQSDLFGPLPLEGRRLSASQKITANKGIKMTNKEPGEPIYPCKFPIKVIGENTEELEKIIIKVMSSFGEVINSDGMTVKRSKNDKYLSITFTIIAKSREYLEQIYSELNAQNEVKMVM